MSGKPKRKGGVKPFPLHAVTAGTPVPKDFCDQMGRALDDARSGKVTSIAWVAIGPDFARWGNAFMRGRADRMSVLGQLAVLTRDLCEQENSETEDEE